ncbi:MAG TPA: superoxide dismutase family protein [Burkholderiales bacterium]|nr:superoxide dismutase family protein [Burkholderiales bacterium]
MKTLIAASAVIVLCACQTMSQQGPRASADLKPTKGSNTSGQATFTQVADKVRVVVEVQGLKPGAEHGFHIHEVGDCSSGDGMSTKGHFNPFGKAHGHHTSAEHHAGDLPSLRADSSGRAKINVDIPMISVTPGAGSVVGRGLIVHADPDDYKTQPTGNAGARVACAVIQAS